MSLKPYFGLPIAFGVLALWLGLTSPPPIGAQELPGSLARLVVTAVDCSSGEANLDDVSTCVPIADLPFLFEYIGPGGQTSNVGFTNPDGVIDIRFESPASETITYLDEVDLNLVPLVDSQVIDLEPGDIGELVFIFFAPVAPPENRARLIVSAVDCSGDDADPDDPSTCGTLSSVPLLFEYDGIGGVSSNIGYTNLDGVFDVQFDAPATETVTFLDDETNLRLVPLDPVQSASLEPGELGELLFVFVDPDDDGEPVTELPNTGSGDAAVGTATRAEVTVVAAIGMLLAGVGTGRRRVGASHR